MKSLACLLRNPFMFALMALAFASANLPAQVMVDPGAICPAPVQAYRIAYQTVFEEHQVTSFRVEHETVCDERQITVQRPVLETQMHERRYTVQRPLMETSEREERYTVMRPVTETRIEDRSYDRVRNVFETIEREVRHCVQRPVYETSEREERHIVRRLVTETAEHEQCHTVLEPVVTHTTRYVDQGCFQDVAVCKPGPVCNRLAWVPSTCAVDPCAQHRRATGCANELRAEGRHSKSTRPGPTLRR
jgi:hypothetical protein